MAHAPREICDALMNQFGFREGNETNFAKMRLYCMAKNNGFTKNVQIDIRKVYDSVNTSKLLILTTKFFHTSTLARDIVNLLYKITLNYLTFIIKFLLHLLLVL
jgi:hypothetical protein